MKYRRLTIAALVLLVLGGGLWWSTRPNVDPKMLWGIWIGLGDEEIQSTFTFYERGNCQTRFNGGNVNYTVGFDWQLWRDRLVLLPEQTGKSATKATWSRVSAFLGIGRPTTQYRILKIDDRELVLEAIQRSFSGPQSIRLRRLRKVTN